jgi:2-oxo-4-hydroxy-4-carboxy-5-ureidoimidazoline decarboxylase
VARSGTTSLDDVNSTMSGFTRLPNHQQLSMLLAVCSSTVWARRVLASGPFSDVGALLDCADRVLAELPDVEIDAALDGHPWIGAEVDNASSAREQAAVVTAADSVKAELAARNAEYDQKFGYVYLVCASGRSAEELLAILTDRLHNDPETERGVMRGELAKINRLRLERLLSESGS